MDIATKVGGLIPVPFTIFRNDSNTVSVKIYESDGSTPLDITGSTVFFAAKWSVYDTAAALELSSTDSLEIAFTDPTQGELTLTFSGTSTLDLPIGVLELPYELRVTTAALINLPVLFGTLRVLPNVVT